MEYDSRGELSLSASEWSDGDENVLVKQELWETEPRTREERDRNRRNLDVFAKLHQRRVKQEWGQEERRRARKRSVEEVSLERGSSTSRRETVERAAVIKGECVGNYENNGRIPSLTCQPRPRVLTTREAGWSHETEGFSPMKIELASRKEPMCRDLQRPMPSDPYRQYAMQNNLSWQKAEEHFDTSVFPESDTENGAESDESEEPQNVFTRSAATKPGKSTRVGPWGSISQQSMRGSAVSGSKRVTSQRSKRKKGKRIRRVDPMLVRYAENEQKKTIRNLQRAEMLWKKLELPVHVEELDPLQGVDPEVLRYAKQGKRFIELALSCGTIKAKNRVRDEWKAYCYKNGIDAKTSVQNTGFDEVVERYRRQVDEW